MKDWLNKTISMRPLEKGFVLVFLVLLWIMSRFVLFCFYVHNNHESKGVKVTYYPGEVEFSKETSRIISLSI